MKYQDRDICVGDFVKLDSHSGSGWEGTVFYIEKERDVLLCESKDERGYHKNSFPSTYLLDPSRKYFWVITDAQIVSIIPAVKITNSPVTKPKQEKILSCKECHTFCPMAEANQSDGTFVCYSCRSTSWKYKIVG